MSSSGASGKARAGIASLREDPIYVSINMSSQQLFHNDLVQNLRLIIGRETLPKGALRLEIAETLINSNPEQAMRILDWLKSLNVSVALDEFGVSSVPVLLAPALHRRHQDRPLPRLAERQGAIQRNGA